jgi:hypothetical protein
MPLDMPPMNTEDTAAANIEQQKAGTSAEDMVNDLMKKEGLRFASTKMEVKKSNPSESDASNASFEKQQEQIGLDMQKKKDSKEGTVLAEN